MSYPNLFAEIGMTEEQINAKIEDTFNTMFFDPEERFYFERGDNMGYMMDTGNNDARTEGMSYGMMMAVQVDRQDIFDRLWLFSKNFMHHKSGKYEGYFAWSVSTEGVKNYQGPAPDGEEYYALALFFAASRWGDREEPFNYSVQAKDILRHCLHQHEIVEGGNAMWDHSNYYIKFIPEADYSDPSYHLPHFYKLFSERADECDRDFWEKAVQASREYIAKSSHPVTGMAPEFAEYDGKPKHRHHEGEYYSDAYRVAMNIGLDAAWYGKNAALSDAADNLQRFFSENTKLLEYNNYKLDGTALDEPALHPYAIVATNAAASLAANGEYRLQWVKDFWELPLRKGDRRYYDNCLHFFCLLMLSGRYRIY